VVDQAEVVMVAAGIQLGIRVLPAAVEQTVVQVAAQVE
jgi:hypothetical protein